jgi:outer membrane protein TolC
LGLPWTARPISWSSVGSLKAAHQRGSGSVSGNCVAGLAGFDWASHFYSVGPTISIPIFEGGLLVSNLHLAKAQQVEAALNYRKTVLNALGEVEIALIAFRTDQARYESLAAAVRSSADALALARDRYEHGLSSFIDVLDAERTLVQARDQQTQTMTLMSTDLVALYRALGGGWQAPVR